MFNLLFKSWLVGLLSAGLLMLPLSRVWEPSQNEGLITEIGLRIGVFVANIPLAMWISGTVGAIVAMPVVVALGLCGWLFKEQMHRYPNLWAFGFGLIMLFVAAAGAVIVDDHPLAETYPPMQLFFKLLISWLSLSIAVPTALATRFFAKRVTETTRIPPAYGAR